MDVDEGLINNPEDEEDPELDDEAGSGWDGSDEAPAQFVNVISAASLPAVRQPIEHDERRSNHSHARTVPGMEGATGPRKRQLDKTMHMEVE